MVNPPGVPESGNQAAGDSENYTADHPLPHKEETVRDVQINFWALFGLFCCVFIIVVILGGSVQP